MNVMNGKRISVRTIGDVQTVSVSGEDFANIVKCDNGHYTAINTHPKYEFDQFTSERWSNVFVYVSNLVKNMENLITKDEMKKMTSDNINVFQLLFSKYVIYVIVPVIAITYVGEALGFNALFILFMSIVMNYKLFTYVGEAIIHDNVVSLIGDRCNVSYDPDENLIMYNYK